MLITLEALTLKRWGSLPQSTILSIDPGETTGIAVFQGIQLIFHDQVVGAVDEQAAQIYSLLKEYTPHKVVIEEYRIYQWQAQNHAWSDVFTARLIGALEYVVRQSKIPLYKQTAQVAKNFATDKKLKDWGFWIKGKKHARDAIRHGLYNIIFKGDGGSNGN